MNTARWLAVLLSVALVSRMVAAAPSLLLPNDGQFYSSFGGAVAVAGSVAVIGAEGQDLGTGFDQGAVYIYLRQDSGWMLVQRITAPDGLTTDGFGTSVALSGDTVIVGAALANSSQGTAYVFTRRNGTWGLEAKLTADDGRVGARFGTAVAVEGNTVVVGANQDGTNQYQGAAYVYTRTGTTWTLQTKLTASDGEAGDLFGTAVSLYGNTVAVGASLDNVGINQDQGSVYLFTRTGTTWTPVSRVVATNGGSLNFFGAAVALGPDTLIIGALQDNIGANLSQGSAYVFNLVSGVWTQKIRLLAPDGTGGDRFGASVSLQGDILTVGAEANTIGNNLGQGAAYLYQRLNGSWSFQQQVVAPDGLTGDAFAQTVALGGGGLLVGAFGHTVDLNASQGAAYWYPLTSAAPVLSTVSASRLLVGDTLTLTGSNFTGTTTITLNGVPLDFTVLTDSQILITIPAGTTSGSLLLVTPTGTLSTALVVAPLAIRANQWQLVGTADFNTDGQLDLLWRNYTTGTNEVWLMNGYTYVSTLPLPVRTDLNWQLVGAVDFTQDAKPDLLWRNYTTGVNEVWQMDDASFIQTLPLLTVSDLNWQLVQAVDFSQDGQPDLLWRNYLTGENAIWQMNGTTYEQAIYLDSVSDFNWQLVQAADFIQDGQPDLVWRNYSTGENAIWQMDGYSYVQAFLIGAVTDRTWQMVAAADLTNDTQPDLLWRNALSGDTYLWQMNGYSYVRAFFVGNRPV